jgi:hypothetical protein
LCTGSGVTIKQLKFLSLQAFMGMDVGCKANAGISSSGNEIYGQVSSNGLPDVLWYIFLNFHSLSSRASGFGTDFD